MREVSPLSRLNAFKLLLISSTFFLLLSCASHRPAPIKDSNGLSLKRPASYVVVPGDTLFGISWRYGLKYDVLARYNGISAPYIIRPGQIIRLDLRGVDDNGNSDRSSHDAPKISPPSSRITGTQKINNQEKNAHGRKVNQTPAFNADTSGSRYFGAPQWQWPAKGALLSQFQGSVGLSKGIDIAGKLGEPVVAAAAGQVVYAGSGLRGYGKLLIIKHNEMFLSAYAHNNNLRVKEGDLVKVGQLIADIGSTGADRVKLHFEIRRDGMPVDPLKFLPRR